MVTTRNSTWRNLAGMMIVGTVALWVVAARSQEQVPDVSVVPAELLVKFRPAVDETRKTQLLASRSARLLKRFQQIGIDQVALPAGQSVFSAVAAFLAMPDVELAQPNYVRRIVAPAPPNDPYWLSDALWGLARIQAPQVWTTHSTGSSSIIVADIDTGVEYTHPDLAANMWRNPGETAGNGVDDDGNGSSTMCSVSTPRTTTAIRWMTTGTARTRPERLPVLETTRSAWSA